MQRSLLNAINDFITEAGDTFHKDGYIAANLERLIEIPDPIDRFEELTGRQGWPFYEVICRVDAKYG